MTGEGMQNEQNSMNVQLSKSLTPVLKVDKLDESGDSFHRADNIERDNAAAGKDTRTSSLTKSLCRFETYKAT